MPGDGQLLAYEESRYARLIVQKQGDQATLFADGRPISGSHQIAQAETAVHYPLSQLGPSPRILLISAQGGMLEEIRKYHPQAVDFVDLDPMAAQMQIEYGIMNPIAHLRSIHMDGRRWLSTTDSTYDAILVNLPDPDTFQLNRFFTDRFYSLAAQRLAGDGILSFHVQGFANTMTDHQRHKLASLLATARTHFRHVRPLPGERIYFLCRQRPIDVDIPARLADKGISTRYIEAFFYGDVSAERIAALDREVDLTVRLNRDKSPFLMRLALVQWFDKFGATPVYFIFALALTMSAFLWRRSQQELVLFTSGWALMGGEILLIFAYQIFFGYIYLQLGGLVTVFLLGLLPGAWLGYRWKPRTANMLLISEILLVFLMAMVAGLFQWGGDGLPSGVYYLWGFLISSVCGFQFPQALILLQDTDPSATRLFSADLLGAACGALVTGTVLVPYLGLVGAALALMGVKLINLAIVGGRGGYAAPESA
jgi:spermidine synthase